MVYKWSCLVMNSKVLFDNSHTTIVEKITKKEFPHNPFPQLPHHVHRVWQTENLLNSLLWFTRLVERFSSIITVLFCLWAFNRLTSLNGYYRDYGYKIKIEDWAMVWENVDFPISNTKIYRQQIYFISHDTWGIAAHAKKNICIAFSSCKYYTVKKKKLYKTVSHIICNISNLLFYTIVT